ncbi:hypothetical protein GCM10022251_24670 [Phytohabitans flavus]|uniref:Uncharacterized protein n=1 Tax=Phytohabitans flavus TaxID=1076124 RepID=A0A6F8XRF7_9ACTN|nr:hypothetical protein Pflav_027410 [Phytohabitans flavus]
MLARSLGELGVAPAPLARALWVSRIGFSACSAAVASAYTLVSHRGMTRLFVGLSRSGRNRAVRLTFLEVDGIPGTVACRDSAGTGRIFG